MKRRVAAWAWVAVVAALALAGGCGEGPAGQGVTPSPADPRATATPVLAAPVAGSMGTTLPVGTEKPAAPASPCGLAPLVAPTPAADPGYTELDPTTGLHVTGRMQILEMDTYRLRVTGKVDRPLELSFEEIRCLPRIEASPVLTCPGTFVDYATWAGTPISEVLALAGVQAGARSVRFRGADGYDKGFRLETALDPGSYLAYEWEGEPLPRLHGFPLRVVVTGGPGYQWLKWLIEIEVE